ncbi:MAG: 3-hydroxy-3-methylglutaryl CoA synthase [Chloroflexi bacterium]|nr:3-hydroxy-3-methylglutaryl CoA synthase [Chloroflexota bacterium]
MPGIAAVGAYIPKYRMPRSVIAQAWGSGGGPGERSVASYDEDTMTMAVNAVVDLLKAHGRNGVDALYFASTTPSYREKLSAAVIAAAADLGPTIRTADFGGSLRSGTQALLAALDAVNAGTANAVIVVAADSRKGYPRSNFEAAFGDAAAAVVVSKTNVAVEVTHQATRTNDIADVWRRDSDPFVRSWEDRFVITHGYDQTTKAAVKDLFAKANIGPADVTRAAIYGPDARSHTSLMRGLGFNLETQVQDPLITTVGNSGAAHALLMMVAALEEAKAGDTILVASYGDGADAMLLKVTKPVKRATGVKGHLAYKRPLTSYDRFLAYRSVLVTDPEPPLRVEAWGASTTAWREQAQTTRLHGSRCNKCGTVTHPIQRICYTCQSKDDYTEVRLYDTPGAIYAFTRDNLAGGLETPVMNCVVESDESACRIFSTMTDADPDEAKIGARIEFTYRKMHEAANFHNYYWKVRPAINGE